MPLLPIGDLTQFGYVPDATPSSLPANAFSYVRNYRFNQAGYVEVTRGYNDAYSDLLTSTSLGANAEATFLYSWPRVDNPGVVIYDSNDRLLKYVDIESDNSGFDITDLSSTAHTDTEDISYRWQATEAFGIPIFNNTLEAPCYYNETESSGVVTRSVSALTNWPTDATCRFLTNHTAFLIAVGYQDDTATVANEGGTKVVAISDVIQIPGTFPAWDFDNTSSFSQIFDLSLHTDGDLLNAYEQNGVLYVNSTTNVIAMSYLGDGEWDAQALPFPNGTLSSKSIAEIPTGFFHIGNRSMWMHDGNSPVNIGEGKWVQTWFDSYEPSRIDEIQCEYDPRTKSIWIKTPTGDSSQEMWVYNLENDTIAPLDDQQDINYITFSTEGIPAVDVSWDSLPTDSTWDTLDFDSWNEIAQSEGGATFRNRVIGVADNTIIILDHGTTFNGRDINAVLRREDLRTHEDSYRSVQLTRILPVVSSNTSGSTLTIRVGGSENSNESIRWQPSRTLQVDTGQKLDYRTTVKWAAVEFTSSTSGQIIDRYELEYRPTGGR